METVEGISKAIVFLGRQFNKVLKSMDMKSIPDVENMSVDIRKNSDLQRKARIEENPNQEKAFTGRYESDEDQ